MVSAEAEQFRFDADVKNLLTILINNIYSDKSVAPRELISNASDAIDQLRRRALDNNDICDMSEEFKIEVYPNDEEKTLTIKDNGAGMTKAELINNLGTIAMSGTRKFLQQTNSAETSNMIGQFGVGFYSAFLLADRVEVISTSFSEPKTHVWESSASTSFSIKETTDYDLKRGTMIVLHIKEGCSDYLKESTLEDVIKKHSGFINYPIYLQVQKSKEVSDDEEEPEEEKKTEDGDIEEVKEEDKKKEKKKKTVHYSELKKINTDVKVWTKKPSEITEEEYTKVYKSLTHNYEKPFLSKTFQVQGASDFSATIFIHARSKKDVFQAQSEMGSPHAKLFLKSVFVTDFNKQKSFFESYLQSIAFVIVDVQDMPSSVNREGLVSEKYLKIFKRNIKQKLMKIFSEIKENSEKYEEFLKNHSKALKLGVIEDAIHGPKDLIKFVPFYHSLEEKNTTFEEYVSNMPKEQEQIYYISGKNLTELREDPTVCALKEKKIDVLLFDDALDEFVVNKLREYDGKKFQDICKEGFKLNTGEDSTTDLEKSAEEYKEFCTKVKSILGNNVSAVKVKDNFVGPVSIQVPDHGMSAVMETMQKNQPLGGDAMGFFNSSMKVLAVNPNDKLIHSIKDKVVSDSPIGKEAVKILYRAAVVKAGYPIEDPVTFSNQLLNMVNIAVSDSPISESVNSTESNDPKADGADQSEEQQQSVLNEVD